MAEPGRVPLTPELLEDFYVRQGLTCREIAQRCGYAGMSPVQRAMAQAGIPARKSGARPRPHVPAHRREVLEQLYVDQQLSARAIAAQLGYRSHSQVMLDLKTYGVPLRAGPRAPGQAKPELTEVLLRQLYCEEAWPPARIAEHTGTAPDSVRHALGRHGIALRRPRRRRSGRCLVGTCRTCTIARG